MWALELVISNDDYAKVMSAIDHALGMGFGDPLQLAGAQAELSRAAVVSPAEVPNDVVTMGSRFELAGPTPGAIHVHTLVLPHERREGGVSVLSPMGRTLLGTRVGRRVSWREGDGARSATVLRLLEQPEWLALYPAASRGRAGGDAPPRSSGGERFADAAALAGVPA